jgi:hypothetical protein
MNDYSAVSRPEGVLDYNRHYINELPITSPHGSNSNALRELLELYRFERRAWHSSATPREDVCILEISFVLILLAELATDCFAEGTLPATNLILMDLLTERARSACLVADRSTHPQH